MSTTQAHHLNGHETIPAPDARPFDGADRYLRADSPAPDADADDLRRRTGAIGHELHALVERAVGVRDQHARQIDALKAELAAVSYGRSLALAALGLILGHTARTTGVCLLCGCALTENSADGEGCAVGAVISELGR